MFRPAILSFWFSGHSLVWTEPDLVPILASWICRYIEASDNSFPQIRKEVLSVNSKITL